MNWKTIVFIILIILAIFLVGLQLLLNMKDTADKACEEIGLKNEEGGNCCFIVNGSYGISATYSAIPCDELLKKVMENENADG